MNSKGQIKLFIVEDNFVYSFMLEAMLKDYGNFKITSFNSGEECIELLDNNPDIIILDYNLEGKLNGSDAFKMIHSKKPKTPVIILSSQKDVQIAADLLQNGVFDYIQKSGGELALTKLRDSVFKALKM